MITQNPISGRSKGKLARVYARTLFGKNILQTCPPPTRGKQTPTQIAVCKAFGYVSRLANQISPSILNNIYYQQPVGRSRRAQWNKSLAKGMHKNGSEWIFDPMLIENLGGNPKVTSTPLVLTPTSSQFRITFDQFSIESNADLSQVPCLILLCPSKELCISLLPYTSIEADGITINNLTTTVLNTDCYIYPLWAVNVGTSQTPIMAYGSYQKDII